MARLPLHLQQQVRILSKVPLPAYAGWVNKQTYYLLHSDWSRGVQLFH